MKFPNEGKLTEELPKDGFDWITDKIRRLKRVKFGYLDTFWQFSLKRFVNFSLFLAYNFLSMILIKGWIWLNDSKGHFQSRKGQVWPIFP